MAQDFDHPVAKLQVRAAILNRFTALGTSTTVLYPACATAEIVCGGPQEAVKYPAMSGAVGGYCTGTGVGLGFGMQGPIVAQTPLVPGVSPRVQYFA